MKLFWVFVVHTTFLFTKCWPFNHQDATITTAMNLRYNVHHITVCAFSLYSRNCIDSTLCSCLDYKKMCMKPEILKQSSGDQLKPPF